MEIEADRLIAIGFLLLRQRDVAAHALPARLQRAPVPRFHDARPAAGDDRELRLCEQLREPLGGKVIWIIGRGAR